MRASAAVSVGIDGVRDGRRARSGARGGRADQRGWGSREGECEAAAMSKGEVRARRGGERGCRRLKASRPLIRVLVINDNGLWINDFI